MGLFKVNAPPPRYLPSEISQILSQYGASALAQYQNAAAYDPQYQNLQLGLYGQAVPQINSILNQANTATRSAGQADLASLGAQYGQAIQAINPGQTGLYNQLVQQAGQGLSAGSRLTPDQQYQATNPSRSAWAARGFTADALPGQLDQAVNLARAGDNTRVQRQNFAQQVAQQGNNMYTQPALSSILGTGSQAAGQYGAISGQNPDTFNSLLGYGSDLFNTNYNAQAAANIATSNNRVGAVTGAANNLASSY